MGKGSDEVGRSAAKLHETWDPTTNGTRGAGRWVVDGSAGRPSDATGRATPMSMDSRVGLAMNATERVEPSEKDSGRTMSQLSGTQGSSQYNSASGTKSTELARCVRISRKRRQEEDAQRSVAGQ